jgi:CelD/BcsL family acetyltransferase involved in cellulose biosynthesis
MSGACFSPEPADLARPAGARLEEACRVSVLRSARELAALVPQWEALAAQAMEPNPFHEHWLMLPALEALGAGEDFLCAAVWSGGRLDAMFPLERRRRFKGMPLRALVSWRHRHSMLCTPLIRKGCAAESLAALFRWLRSPDGASVLQLDYLAADGPVQLALIDALNAARLTPVTLDSYTRALMLAGRDAGSYMQTALSESFRKKMARNERRLKERGVLEHRVLREHDDIERWIDEFLRLEASGWKGHEGGALACTEPNARFARQVFRAAFERGRLLMLGIDLDGMPIARMCGFTAGEGSFAFKSAYDEALASYAPGILVELDWIRRVHETPGLRWSDSYTAPGNEMIRRLWKGARAIQRLAIGADLRGELALAALPLIRLLKRAIGR